MVASGRVVLSRVEVIEQQDVLRLLGLAVLSAGAAGAEPQLMRLIAELGL